jgi:hypothetical protein
LTENARVAGRPSALSSGLEPLTDPALVQALIAKPIVEAVVAVLPELDGVGSHQVATPERRQRDVLDTEPVGDLGRRRLERRAVGDGLTLT